MNVKKGNFRFNIMCIWENNNAKSSHHDNGSTLQTQLGPTYSSKADKLIAAKTKKYVYVCQRERKI